MTTVLATALEVNGFEVVVTDNGQEALRLAMTDDFDLAIIDQLMPGMLGIEVLQKIRYSLSEMPVIILSGVDDDEVVVGSLRAGAADFVRKPFRLAELVARIEKHLPVLASNPQPDADLTR